MWHEGGKTVYEFQITPQQGLYEFMDTNSWCSYERANEVNNSLFPQVCYDHKCQDVKVYGQTEDCSSKCHNNGVSALAVDFRVVSKTQLELYGPNHHTLCALLLGVQQQGTVPL